MIIMRADKRIERVESNAIKSTQQIVNYLIKISFVYFL